MDVTQHSLDSAYQLTRKADKLVWMQKESDIRGDYSIDDEPSHTNRHYGRKNSVQRPCIRVRPFLGTLE